MVTTRSALARKATCSIARLTAREIDDANPDSRIIVALERELRDGIGR